MYLKRILSLERGGKKKRFEKGGERMEKEREERGKKKKEEKLETSTALSTKILFIFHRDVLLGDGKKRCISGSPKERRKGKEARF